MYHQLTLFCLFQSYTFLISSDYERAEWKEMIKEQQKKCKTSIYFFISSCIYLFTYVLHFESFPVEDQVIVC